MTFRLVLPGAFTTGSGRKKTSTPFQSLGDDALVSCSPNLTLPESSLERGAPLGFRRVSSSYPGRCEPPRAYSGSFVRVISEIGDQATTLAGKQRQEHHRQVVYASKAQRESGVPPCRRDLARGCPLQVSLPALRLQSSLEPGRSSNTSFRGVFFMFPVSNQVDSKRESALARGEKGGWEQGREQWHRWLHGFFQPRKLEGRLLFSSPNSGFAPLFFGGPPSHTRDISGRLHTGVVWSLASLPASAFSRLRDFEQGLRWRGAGNT